MPPIPHLARFSVAQPLWRLVATRGPGGLPRSTHRLGQAATRLCVQGRVGDVAHGHMESCVVLSFRSQRSRTRCVCRGRRGARGAREGQVLQGHGEAWPQGPRLWRPPTQPPSSSPGSAPQGVFCPKRGERSACTGVLKREEGSYCSCYFSNPFSPQSGCGFLGRMFRVHITHSTSSGPG